MAVTKREAAARVPAVSKAEQKRRLDNEVAAAEHEMDRLDAVPDAADVADAADVTDAIVLDTQLDSSNKMREATAWTPPDPALLPQVPVAPIPFPAPPDGAPHWTADEHDQAVNAYEAALESANPDAGRMRTVLGLFSYPGRPLHTGKQFGVQS